MTKISKISYTIILWIIFLFSTKTQAQTINQFGTSCDIIQKVNIQNTNTLNQLWFDPVSKSYVISTANGTDRQITKNWKTILTWNSNNYWYVVSANYKRFANYPYFILSSGNTKYNLYYEWTIGREYTTITNVWVSEDWKTIQYFASDRSDRKVNILVKNNTETKTYSEYILGFLSPDWQHSLLYVKTISGENILVLDGKEIRNIIPYSLYATTEDQQGFLLLQYKYNKLIKTLIWFDGTIKELETLPYPHSFIEYSWSNLQKFTFNSYSTPWLEYINFTYISPNNKHFILEYPLTKNSQSYKTVIDGYILPSTGRYSPALESNTLDTSLIFSNDELRPFKIIWNNIHEVRINGYRIKRYVNSEPIVLSPNQQNYIFKASKSSSQYNKYLIINGKEHAVSDKIYAYWFENDNKFYAWYTDYPYINIVSCIIPPKPTSTIGTIFENTEHHELSNTTNHTNELADSITWLYQNGLTRFSNTSTFHPEDTLLREQASKFFSEFLLRVKPSTKYNETKNCIFSDISFADSSLQNSILNVCKLEVMWWSKGFFNPKKTLTYAQALAVIIRIVDGQQNEEIQPRYQNYYQLALEHGLLNSFPTDIKSNIDKPAKRGDVAILLYRTFNYFTKKK